MPILFQSAPGSVVRLIDPAAQCSAQLMKLDPAIEFETERSIVTRLMIAQQVNVQFLHTLGALIHVYVFGDRMGLTTLSGLSFSCDCSDGTGLGAERMLNWYKRNRASKRADPVRLTIGQTVIEGFAVNCQEDVIDPSTSLVQWSVTLTALPEDSD